jgi:hypothetical protein
LSKLIDVYSQIKNDDGTKPISSKVVQLISFGSNSYSKLTNGSIMQKASTIANIASKLDEVKKDNELLEEAKSIVQDDLCPRSFVTDLKDAIIKKFQNFNMVDFVTNGNLSINSLSSFLGDSIKSSISSISEGFSKNNTMRKLLSLDELDEMVAVQEDDSDES